MPQGASAANPSNVAIKLYPDADGRVGRIEVNGRDGSRLGFLTQGASGFTIRPGAMGRFAAVPLVISPQQALRDQGIVRQVHAAQSVGRQIVTQRRIQRQQNPNRNPSRVNPGANPPRQPGLQKQNGLPQRPGTPQQPVRHANPRCRTVRASRNCSSSRPDPMRTPACGSSPDCRTGRRCCRGGRCCPGRRENRARKSASCRSDSRIPPARRGIAGATNRLAPRTKV